MNAQTNSNLLDLINTQVKTVEAQRQEQLKIMEAAKAAKRAKKDAITYNGIRKSAANKMVSDIQAQLARDLKNIDTEAQNAYKAEMIRLGLDSNKYPLQTSLDFLDHQAVTPILETVGKVAGTMTNVGKGIFNRIGQGFKTATK